MEIGGDMAQRKKSHNKRKESPRAKRGLGIVGLAMILTAAALLLHEEPHEPRADFTQAAAPQAVAPPPVGHLVKIRLPIAGTADQSVRSQINRIVQKAPQAGTVMVLEFGEDKEQTGVGSEFGRCYELARLLLSEELKNVRTVAYIPHRLEGHALLVAMACQEIVMHDDAELGRAGGDDMPIGNVEREAYEDVYAQRQTLPAMLALAMLDPKLEVYQADVQGGSRWADAKQLEELKSQPGFNGFETVVKRGDLGEFTADELRTKYSIISRKVADRADLAGALKLSELSENAGAQAQWNAIRFELRGGINEELATSSIQAIRERLQTAEAAGEPINFICLTIDSPGGSAADSIALIEEIEGLQREGIYVAAYVPLLARSDAAIIALACDSVLIDPDAVLGGSGAAVLSENEVSDLVDRVQAIAKRRGQRWSLPAAMIDRRLKVQQYTNAETNQVAYFAELEWQNLPDKEQWQAGPILSDVGSLLKVDGVEAVDLQLADQPVSSMAEFQRHFGMENEPELVQQNWAHWFVEELKAAVFLPYFLLFFGTSALITELSSPGLVGPGFIALLFYALFFWLAFLKGDANALEIVLFLVGAVCIGLEIFVVPGFGIFGIGGGIMVTFSIVLASQTWVIPRNEYQLEQLPSSLMTVITAAAGLLIGMFVMHRFFGKLPGFNRIVLQPLSEEEQAEVDRRERLADFAHLQGKRGSAATLLMPSGKARFGDDLVDVMTDGAAVEKGAAVVVVGVQGNVVVVEPVE